MSTTSPIEALEILSQLSTLTQELLEREIKPEKSQTATLSTSNGSTPNTSIPKTSQPIDLSLIQVSEKHKDKVALHDQDVLQALIEFHQKFAPERGTRFTPSAVVHSAHEEKFSSMVFPVIDKVRQKPSQGLRTSRILKEQN